MKSASWDHPRLCGEKSQHVRRRVIKPGSPPPMRGKATIFSCASIFAGITPAYAGKSVKSAGLFQCCEDHPRLCGEKAPNTGRTTGRTGSPPPMRGKVGEKVSVAERHGITPAYAGKSNARSLSPTIRWDHPRLCGEKQVPTMGSICKAGSPPPMRGKDHDVSFFQKRPRITPAYAGKRR